MTGRLDNTRLFMSLTAGAGTRCMSLLSSSPNLLSKGKRLLSVMKFLLPERQSTVHCNQGVFETQDIKTQPQFNHNMISNVKNHTTRQ